MPRAMSSITTDELNRKYIDSNFSFVYKTGEWPDAMDNNEIEFREIRKIVIAIDERRIYLTLGRLARLQMQKKEF